MTLPRELGLRLTEKGLRLVQNPVPETNLLREKVLIINKSFKVENDLKLKSANSPLTEMSFEINLSKTTAKIFGIELSNSKGEVYKIGFDVSQNAFYSDRTRAGNSGFSDKFAVKKHFAPRSSKDKIVRFHLFFDAASVELFADNGQTALTEIFFPTEDFSNYKIFSEGGNTGVEKLNVWKLNSIWK